LAPSFFPALVVPLLANDDEADSQGDSADGEADSALTDAAGIAHEPADAFIKEPAKEKDKEDTQNVLHGANST